MPGATVGFVPVAPSGVPSAAVDVRQRANAGNVVDVSFLIWLAIFGVIVPTLVLGGLHAGRFRFVFLGR